MRTFNIYSHQTRGYEAVKVGFSWPAFVFGFWWMLCKRLWIISVVWFIGIVTINLASRAIDHLSNIGEVTDAAQTATVTTSSYNAGPAAFLMLCAAVVHLVLWIVPGLKGNKWRENNLQKRGYQKAGTTQAETPDAAIATLASKP